jgi:hypothetical protein
VRFYRKPDRHSRALVCPLPAHRGQQPALRLQLRQPRIEFGEILRLAAGIGFGQQRRIDRQALQIADRHHPAAGRGGRFGIGHQRYIELRHSHAPKRIAESVAHIILAVGLDLHAAGVRRRLAGADPLVDVGHRRLRHIAHRHIGVFHGADRRFLGGGVMAGDQLLRGGLELGMRALIQMADPAQLIDAMAAFYRIALGRLGKTLVIASIDEVSSITGTSIWRSMSWR